jgi:hypothetical protein
MHLLAEWFFFSFDWESGISEKERQELSNGTNFASLFANFFCLHIYSLYTHIGVKNRKKKFTNAHAIVTLHYGYEDGSFILFRPYYGDFEPSSLSLSWSSELGGVESVRIAVLWPSSFWKSSLVFDLCSCHIQHINRQLRSFMIFTGTLDITSKAHPGSAVILVVKNCKFWKCALGFIHWH